MSVKMTNVLGGHINLLLSFFFVMVFLVAHVHTNIHNINIYWSNLLSDSLCQLRKSAKRVYRKTNKNYDTIEKTAINLSPCDSDYLTLKFIALLLFHMSSYWTTFLTTLYIFSSLARSMSIWNVFIPCFHNFWISNTLLFLLNWIFFPRMHSTTIQFFHKIILLHIWVFLIYLFIYLKAKSERYPFEVHP